MRRERPRRRAAEQRDGISACQLIESHSFRTSQKQLAGYRFIKDQSAGFRPSQGREAVAAGVRLPPDIYRESEHVGTDTVCQDIWCLLV